MKVRLLAPWTDKDNNPHAPNAVIDVDDETAITLMNAGKASDEAASQKALKDAQEGGSYDSLTTRASTPAAADKPAPTEKPKAS